MDNAPRPPIAKLPRSRWAPLFFPTYASRVRFVIFLTVMLLGAGTAAALLSLWHSYRTDAAHAHDQAAHAMLGTVTAAPRSLAEVLVSLGDATRSTGACDRELASAKVGLPYALRVGVADSEGHLLCQTKGGAPAGMLDSTVVGRANASGGFSAGDAAMTDGLASVDFAWPFLANGHVTRLAFVTVDVARFAALRPTAGVVLGLVDSRGQHLVRVAGAADGSAQSWGEVPGELTADILAEKAGATTVTDTDGVTRRYVFQPLDGLAAGRLYAYVGIRTRDVYGAADRPVVVIGLLLTALFVLVTALMAALGRMLIARKTNQVVQAMRRILLGELDTDATPRGLGELEGVINLFIQLMDKIEQTRAQVETEVKNRTSALSLSKGITELEKARLEALLASIGEGVIAADRDGRILFLNEAARAAMRWTDGKIEGVPVSDAFRLEDEQERLIERAAWPSVEAMRTGRVIRTQAPVKPFYLRRADRSRLPVRMTASPVVLGKETLGALIVFTDIAAEVEFDQRKSDFISVASHQLRSPSSAVKFMADMMRKGDLGALTPKQKDWVDKLYLASEAMTDLVTELLNISRVETGVKFSFDEQDPNLVVTEALKLMEAAILEKGQKLVFAPAALPPVRYDKFSLAEVIKNFVSNASKYSPVGSSVTVTVSAEGADATRFAVADQGMGIPKADHDQMFNKFFRAGNALKSPVPGTGLGLYYCKTVVEKHSGRIGFDSEEGKGTTFWFVLPNAGPKE